jgi:hypothetical protein
MFQNFVKVDPQTLKNEGKKQLSDPDLSTRGEVDTLTMMLEYAVIDAPVPGKEEVPSFRRVRKAINNAYLHSFSFNFEPEFGGFTERIGNNCNNSPKNNPTFVELWFKSPKNSNLKTCSYRLSADEDYVPCDKGTLNLVKTGQLMTVNTDGAEASEINPELCPDVYSKSMNVGETRYLEFKFTQEGTEEEIFRKFTYLKK